MRGCMSGLPLETERRPTRRPPHGARPETEGSAGSGRATRQRGYTVALIGPDGAGKTTVARRVAERLPVACRYLYMGVSTASSNRALPTTRALHALKRALGASPDTSGPPPRPGSGASHGGGFRGLLRSLRAALRLTNRLAEETYRLVIALSYRHRGFVVLFDRHFFADYYAYDIEPAGAYRPFSRRLHGWFLRHLYPRPDLVFYLDAPADVLLARKGEGSLEALERRRRDYLELASVLPHFEKVDATAPLEEVAADVCARILRSASPGATTERRPPLRSASSATILVTDAWRGSAVAIIRSLARAGYRVVAADSERWSPGLASCHADERLVVPSPAESAPAFIAAMLEAIESRRVDLVIPVTDATLVPLMAARDRLPGDCRLAAPDDQRLEVAMDKSKTLDLAVRLGVPVPETRVVRRTSQALAAGDEIGWPLVVKPALSRVWDDDGRVEQMEVRYATSRTELETAITEVAGRCPVLLQEYCRGTGVGVELLADRGRVVAAFQHRRIHEYPLGGGPSALRASVALDPELFEHSRRLLAEVGWTGLAMVEFKQTSRGPRLMEVNGRVWGSLPLAVASGVDFPALCARLMLGGRVEPDAVPSYRCGVRGRNLELDLKWIVATLRGRRRGLEPPAPRLHGFLALAALADPRVRPDVFSWSDPMPGLVDLARIVNKRFRKSVRRQAV